MRANEVLSAVKEHPKFLLVVKSLKKMILETAIESAIADFNATKTLKAELANEMKQPAKACQRISER